MRLSLHIRGIEFRASIRRREFPPPVVVAIPDDADLKSISDIIEALA